MTQSKDGVPAFRARLKNTVRFEISTERRKVFGLDFFVEKVLKELLDVDAATVNCLQDFSARGFFDLTFHSEAACFNLYNGLIAKKDAPALEGVSVLLLFTKILRPLTMHLYNPFVNEVDIRCFLYRYCAEVKECTKLRDKYGFWNGKRRYMVKLKQDPMGVGGLAHPPGSFAIGPDRGYLHYPGQPEYCRRCGLFGHVKEVCCTERCRICFSSQHKARDCTAPKACTQCGNKEHLFRACPERKRTYAALFSGHSDLRGPSGGSGEAGHGGGGASVLPAPGPVPAPGSVPAPGGACRSVVSGAALEGPLPVPVPMPAPSAGKEGAVPESTVPDPVQGSVAAVVGPVPVPGPASISLVFPVLAPRLVPSAVPGASFPEPGEDPVAVPAASVQASVPVVGPDKVAALDSVPDPGQFPAPASTTGSFPAPEGIMPKLLFPEAGGEGEGIPEDLPSSMEGVALMAMADCDSSMAWADCPDGGEGMGTEWEMSPIRKRAAPRDGEEPIVRKLAAGIKTCNRFGVLTESSGGEDPLGEEEEMVEESTPKSRVIAREVERLEGIMNMNTGSGLEGAGAL